MRVMARTNTFGDISLHMGRRPLPPQPRWIVQKPAIQEEETEGEVLVTFPRQLLRYWNVAMSLLHTLLALVTLALANPDLEVPLFRTSLLFEVLENGTYVTVTNTTERTDGRAFRLWPYFEQQGSLRLVDLTVAFSLVTAGFHLLNATLLWRFYVFALERCYTPTRWLEYAFSAPIMFVLISYGLGMRARSDYVAGVALIATTMFFGFWTEREGRPASDATWTRPFLGRIYPWLLGHIPQLAAWSVVLLQFYDNGWDSARVPWFVHFILWGELTLFFSFGAASFVSQWGPPRYFYRGELCFQVLSLLSKGLLGVLLLSNVLMLQRFDDIYEDTAR